MMTAKPPLALAIQRDPCFFNPHSFTTSSSSSSSSFLRFLLSKPRTSLQTTTTYSSLSPIPPQSFNNSTDPELRTVLELATNVELFQLHHILFAPSYFSPVFKSISPGVNQFDRFMVEEDFQERQDFIDLLHSRFLYLAADARSTLRGWRPSYRNVLLDVRKELNIQCSRKLPTEDLEVEIFIHLLQEWSRDQKSGVALRIGAVELRSLLLKGGQLVALLKISEMVSSRLSRTMLLEAAKRKIGNEVIKKELAGAASRYLGFRSLASFVGPVLWGTLLADIVIQMLGTDYERILRAIYAFAQIRLLRRHGLHLENLTT